MEILIPSVYGLLLKLKMNEGTRNPVLLSRLLYVEAVSYCLLLSAYTHFIHCLASV